MAELWNNIENAIGTIKSLVTGFYDIVSSIFGFIPAPFSDILTIMSIVIIALVAIKIVRG